MEVCVLPPLLTPSLVSGVADSVFRPSADEGFEQYVGEFAKQVVELAEAGVEL